ncbi:hypothetical protein KR084_007928 [Drosophila pseudotakahashii]|nr:hypothetical protein KR084_007928 [Drosophila pseudotakahashii]
MEDPRKRDLKKLIDSFCFQQQSYNFHMQLIKFEDRRLFKSLLNAEEAHKKIEHLEKLWDFKNLLNETRRNLKNVKSTIQKFQELNPELQGTKEFEEATRLIEEQMTMEQNSLNADIEKMDKHFKDLKISG